MEANYETYVLFKEFPFVLSVEAMRSCDSPAGTNLKNRTIFESEKYGLRHVAVIFSILTPFNPPGGSGEGRSAPIVFSQGIKPLFQTAISHKLSD